jgi:hypothetical protein
MVGSSEPVVAALRIEMSDLAGLCGLEGVVATYVGAPYQCGRTSLWQKLVATPGRIEAGGWRLCGEEDLQGRDLRRTTQSLPPQHLANG